MVRYDDPVEVRTGAGGAGGQEGPSQFLWRGRLWKVREVLDRRHQELPRREVWRVAAGRGRLDGPAPDVAEGPGGPGSPGNAVFELVHDVPAGRWQLHAAAARVGE